MAQMTIRALGLLFVTINSIMAIHRSWGDSAATIFIISSCASLILLFYFLHILESAPPGSPARDSSKIGVWLTTTSLTAMFSWRVAVLLPWPVVGAGVCLLGGCTVAGGFYALFILPSSQGD